MYFWWIYGSNPLRARISTLCTFKDDQFEVDASNKKAVEMLHVEYKLQRMVEVQIATHLEKTMNDWIHFVVPQYTSTVEIFIQDKRQNSWTMCLKAECAQ